MPLTGQVIELPAARDATGADGLHVPNVKPAGSPDTLQVALVAAAPPAAFVQTTVPEYAAPTVAEVGNDESETDMSDVAVRL